MAKVQEAKTQVKAHYSTVWLRGLMITTNRQRIEKTTNKLRSHSRRLSHHQNRSSTWFLSRRRAQSQNRRNVDLILKVFKCFKLGDQSFKTIMGYRATLSNTELSSTHQSLRPRFRIHYLKEISRQRTTTKKRNPLIPLPELWECSTKSQAKKLWSNLLQLIPKSQGSRQSWRSNLQPGFSNTSKQLHSLKENHRLQRYAQSWFKTNRKRTFTRFNQSKTNTR